MAAASSEFVGGRMSLVLYYLWFCGDQCIAGLGLYCTSYLISPELDHHMRYEGEQHQNGGIPVTNLSGELRLQIRSWIASVSARGQLGHCIIAWWCLNTWEIRFYPIVWCLLIQGEIGGGSIACVSGSIPGEEETIVSDCSHQTYQGDIGSNHLLI